MQGYPENAHAALEKIKATKREPWAFHAAMSLNALEMGISKLPEDPW